MRRGDVKTVIAYYFGIPMMRRLLAEERAELEEEYSGLTSIRMDGIPHSATLGKPTEELAVRADAKNVRSRLKEISIRDQVLEMDREMIQDCLDALNGEYKMLLILRHRDRCSWGRLAARTGTPETTLRRWHDTALDRIGSALDEAPMADELLGRASRARV